MVFSLSHLKGTYDLLFVVVPLSFSLVQSFLPPSLNLTIAPPADGGNTLDVIFELGRQINTAPVGIPGFTFQEAKIDIPGVTNPRNPSPYNTQPMTYKQHVLFSDLMNTVSSELLTGLDSTLTLFFPSDSPHGFAAASPSISYKAADWVETSFAQDAGVRERSLADVKNFLSIPWFGSRTSEPSIFRFNFANPLIPPTSYRGSVRLHASNFLPRGVPPPKDLLSLQDGWLTVDNAEATRMWLSWEGRSVGDTDP